MAFDPLTLAAIGKGAEGAGSLIDSGWNIYEGLQNLQMNRANSREQRKNAQMSRLMELLGAGQGMSDTVANRGRLFALRNSGV